MMKIKEIEPKLDENGNILPKQESCATCKKRSVCQLFHDTMAEAQAANNVSELILSMYYICDSYAPMFIQFPIIVENILSDLSYDTYNTQKRVGDFVVCVLNEKDYDENAHLGMFLGDLPMSIISLFDQKNKEIRNKFMKNPAMYLFKFKKIFFGMNNRWIFIEKDDDINIIDKSDPQEYIELARKKLHS